MNTNERYKLYSLKSIIWGGFFGSPLASAYFIRQNYLALGELDKARNVLIGGILFTAALFFGIYQVPVEIVDKIPKFLIPAIYTAIIYAYIEKSQGEILKGHKEDGHSFYSGGRVFGISLLIVVLLGGLLYSVVYLSIPKEYGIYDDKMASFYLNEEVAIDQHDNLDGKDYTQVISEINNEIIPKWEENLKILDNVRAMKNFPQDLIEENKLLKEYCQLRIDLMKAIKKSIIIDSQEYENKVESLYQKIDVVISKINSIQ